MGTYKGKVRQQQKWFITVIWNRPKLIGNYDLDYFRELTMLFQDGCVCYLSG